MDSRGFTLLELLIYISILAIITMVIANAFIILNRSRGQVEAKNEVSSNLRFALEKIKREIVIASDLVTPPVRNTGSSTLELVSANQTVRYFASSSLLFRQVNAEAPEQITTAKVKIDTIYFRRLENSNAVLKNKQVSVEIDLTVSYNSSSPDRLYSLSAKTAVGLLTDI